MLPLGEAGLQFRSRNAQGDRALLGVDGDLVAVLDDGDGAADEGFGGDVADDEPMAAAAEASVGDEGDVFAEALAHDGAGGGKHLAHTGAAFRAFHAHDDDVAFLDLVVKDRLQRGFFGLEDNGFAFEFEAFLAADLADGAFGAEVAFEDDEVAVFLERVARGAHDLLVLRPHDLGVLHVLLHRLASDGEAVAVHEAFGDERADERHGATDLHEVVHEILAARLHVREHRRFLADAHEVLDAELHACAVGHGDEMQHGVRRTTERDDEGDGILEGFLRHDVAWCDAALDHVHHGCAGVEAVHELLIGHGGLSAGIWQRHAQGFDGAGHGVGGIHAAAGAFARDGVLFDVDEFFVRDLAVRVFAHGFENGDDVGIALVQTNAARQDGAAIDEDAGAIHTAHGHDAAWHVFVATTDGDEAVHAFATDHGLNGVSNDFARDQGILHPFGAHGNAVGDGDGIEDDALATGRIHALRAFFGETVNVHVARRDHAPGGGDADLRFVEVLPIESHRMQHRAAGGALDTVHDDGAVFAVEVRLLGGGFGFLGHK